MQLTGISSRFMLSQSWFILADLALLRLFRICNKLWVSPPALYYTRVWEKKHQHGISKKQSPGGPLALGHLICLLLTSMVALSVVLAGGLLGCYSEVIASWFISSRVSSTWYNVDPEEVDRVFSLKKKKHLGV